MPDWSRLPSRRPSGRRLRSLPWASLAVLAMTLALLGVQHWQARLESRREAQRAPPPGPAQACADAGYDTSTCRCFIQALATLRPRANALAADESSPPPDAAPSVRALWRSLAPLEADLQGCGMDRLTLAHAMAP